MGYRVPIADTRPGVADSISERLADLYAAYRDRLLRFVIPKVSGDRHAAEDIVQEAFTAALVSLAGFGARSSPYTWLCSIAQHKIADHYRREIPESGTVIDLTDPEKCEDLIDDTEFRSSVERWFETLETRTMVQQALRQLPPLYGEVLRMKYFYGLSVAEMACKLGRSPKAVEGLLARARHALSTQLSAKAS